MLGKVVSGVAVAPVLDLEVTHQPVCDAHGGGGDGIGPHLLHPALHHPLRVAVRTEAEGEVKVARRHAAQLVEVNEQRRGADRVELGAAALGPVAAHDAVLGLVAVHVPKDEGGRRALRGEVRNGPHQHLW